MLSKNSIVFEPAVTTAAAADDAVQIHKDALLIWALTGKQLPSPPISPKIQTKIQSYAPLPVAGKKRKAAAFEDKKTFPVMKKWDDHLSWTIEYEAGHLADLGLVVGEPKLDILKEEGKVSRPGKIKGINGLPNMNYAMYTIIACSPKKQMRLPALIGMVYEWLPVLKENHAEKSQPEAMFRHALCVCTAFAPVDASGKDGWHRLADVGEKEPKLYGKAKVAQDTKDKVGKDKLVEKKLNTLEQQKGVYHEQKQKEPRKLKKAKTRI